MADNYGNKPNRKTYVRGKKMRIDLYITNYVDDVTLNWINSRAVVTSAIWDLVKKEAYREATAMNGQNLGAINNQIQGVPQINSINQIEQPVYQDNQPLQTNVTESSNINMTKEVSDAISQENEIKSAPSDIKSDIEIKDIEKSETIEQIEQIEENLVRDQQVADNQNEEIALTDAKSSDEGSGEKTDGSDSNELNLNSMFKKKKKVSTLKGKEGRKNNLSKIERETLGIKD